jgi:WD40 repeat protein
MREISASSGVSRAYFSQDGQSILAVLGNGSIERFDLASGKLEQKWPAPAKVRQPVIYSRSANLLCSASEGNSLSLYRPGGTAFSATTPATREAAGRLIFAPNGRFLASGYTEERLVRFYEVGGKPAGEFAIGVGGPSCISISPDARFALLAAWDASCQLVNLVTRKVDRSFGDFLMSVFCASFSEDSRSIYLGTADAKLYEIDVASGQAKVVQAKLPRNLNHLVAAQSNTFLSTDSDPASNRLPTELSAWENGRTRVLAKLPRTASSLDRLGNSALTADGSPVIRLHTF